MLSDRDILTDCLASQKHIAHDYLATADHADDPQLLNVLMNLCAEEHQTRLQIYQAMHQRGWYNPQSISPQQVQQAQQQFSQVRQRLQSQGSAFAQTGTTQTGIGGYGQGQTYGQGQAWGYQEPRLPQ